MTTMNAADLAKNIDAVLDRLQGGEEILITRGDRPVARLVPNACGMTAEEAFKDLPGLLTEEEGQAMLDDIAKMDRGREGMRDPWAT